MEGRRSFQVRNGLVCGLLVMFLLFCCTNAADGDNDYKDPRRNVNLAPYQKWRNAYKCLQNITSNCKGPYQLTESGWVNVTAEQTSEYCQLCADHTRAVIECVHVMKHDYEFQKKFSVADVNYTITQGCATEFTGTTLIVPPTNNARKIYNSKTITSVSAIAAWLFITYINM